MRKTWLIDICNSLADLNTELEKRGFRTDIYPAPSPKEIWQDMSIYSTARPIWNIIRLVKKLAETSDIIYLTARPVEAREVTLEWLEKYGLPKAPLIHTNGRLKGEFVRAFQPDLAIAGAIEDAPHEIASYLQAKPDMELLVPDWGYNAHIKDGKRIDLDKKVA
jgi:hypothetical protein